MHENIQELLAALKHRIPVRILHAEGAMVLMVPDLRFVNALRTARVRKGAPVRTSDQTQIGIVEGLSATPRTVILQLRLHDGALMPEKCWMARVTVNRRQRDPHQYTVTSVTPDEDPLEGRRP